MAVKTTEQRNQNTNGRNYGEREITEEQKINDVKQNINYGNEEEMGDENGKIGCTLCLTKKVNRYWSDTDSVYEALKVVSRMLKAWKNTDVNFKIVDKHHSNMELE